MPTTRPRLLPSLATTAALAALSLGASQAAALTVSHTLTVGAAPSGVAFTAGGTKAYVTNQIDKTLSVIDTSGPSVAHTISLGALAPGAIGTGGARAVIAGETGAAQWRAQVFDTASDSPMGSLVTLTSQGNTVSVTPDGQTAFMPTDRYITKLNTSTGTTTLSQQGPLGYTMAALAPDGSQIWATSYSDGKVHVFDAGNIATPPTSFFVLQDAFGITVSPDGTTACVTNGNRGLFPIDTATRTVAPAIPVDGFAYGVAVDPSGKVAFVTRYVDGKVSAIDTATNTVIAEATVGTAPTAIAVDPRGGSAYVINQGSNTVSVIPFGVPGSPAAPSATGGVEKATVTWTPPASDGGLPLTYSAQAVEDPSKTCTADGNATSCDITGLTGGRQYTFTVTARNAMGSSASAASGPVTPTGAATSTQAAPPASAPFARAVLASGITASRTRMVSGQSVRLTIRARNTGPGPAASATACIRLPRSLVTTRANGATWNGSDLCFALGGMPPGAEATRSLTARAVVARPAVARVGGSAQAAGGPAAPATPASVRIAPRRSTPAVTG